MVQGVVFGGLETYKRIVQANGYDRRDLNLLVSQTSPVAHGEPQPETFRRLLFGKLQVFFVQRLVPVLQPVNQFLRVGESRAEFAYGLVLRIDHLGLRLQVGLVLQFPEIDPVHLLRR